MKQCRDVEQAKAELKKLIAENANLKKEHAELKAENDTLKREYAGLVAENAEYNEMTTKKDTKA